MPNVLLTQYCNRSCPYCFAKRHMSDTSPDDVLSWDDLIFLADLLEKSGEKRFGILGGEPTLHPQFNDYMLYLLDRGFHVNVFTNGIMSERKLSEAGRLFRDIPPDRLGFTCNLNDPESTAAPMAELEAVKRFLFVFGEKVVPGVNIYRKEFSLEYIFRYINEFGLQRQLRVGIAHPIVGKKNAFVKRSDIREAIARLFSYRDMFERFRVKPGLDCGFPLCLFEDDELAWLYRVTGGHSEFGCGPVIDVGPDMKVWSCFPLSAHNSRSLYEFNSLAEVHNFYKRIHKSIRTEVGGVFEECDNCVHRYDGVCGGGCLAHSLSRFLNEAPIRMEEVYG